MGAWIFFNAAMIRAIWVSEVMWQWWDEYPVFDISPKKKVTV
jgi:hypothetical protein